MGFDEEHRVAAVLVARGYGVDWQTRTERPAASASAEITVVKMRLGTTQRSAVVMIIGTALAWLLVGCGAPAPGSVATQPTPAAPTTSTSSSTTAAPAGGVVVTGDVRRPGPVTATQLAGMAHHTVSVQFGSAKGTETHTETGVLLSDLLPVSALATTSRKNDQLAFAVVATGSDGYAALVSYGEIAPDFGNRGVLLATTQDGAVLPHPRLVVPGDVKGGRYVTGVVDLHVTRVG